ncbi:MAG: serine/threonine protein kinase [Burkholderiales bacterium]|nr:serine/threonine protein kinase [Burkholderiales bacterium]
MSDNPAPRRTLGRYEILEEIAQGAMGVVYRARDPLIDRIVAIKTVTLGLSDAETEAYEKRFFREAKSAGRLNHPNVVTIFDVGKTEGVAYIAMEFLDGQSLREILDSGVVLSPQRIADIVAEVAEGLAFAHENGVVHRDVKPANIMVLASGAVKITDFGIALLPTGTRTVAGNVFGSPRYTSPEQVMGRPVDGRSDVFSLGATLYEMLTGASPFQGGDLNTILKQVLSDPTPPPSSRNARLPRSFDHIVGKALAKDPADRYQTAGALAADLRRFDALELETPAPGPLPVLEHPTTPLALSDLIPPADVAAPLASVAGEPIAATALARSAGAPWWQQRWVVGAAAAAAILAVIALVTLGGRDDAPATPIAKAPPPTGSAGMIGNVPTAAPPAAATAPPATATAPPATATAPPAAGTAPPAAATAPPATADEPSRPEVASAPEPNAATPVPTSRRADVGAAATPAAGPATADAGAAAGAAPIAAATAPANVAGAASSAPPVARPAPPKPVGRVTFAISPWGEIYIDGRRRGTAPPLQELRLPPGRHVIEVRNATFPPHRETIELGPDEVLRIRHKFQ